ncbi:MAG: aminopeptidase P family protein [Chloroflexi bacterium]|nr:MAG: aminopeptidase P family protein [Chloroflexota bacterium]MBL1196027.1 aminopeptidase P family protein [Chloroflexota bacterium]NOH13321.1 aminopeptidase P family protein [Chloroflexota bacterium]
MITSIKISAQEFETRSEKLLEYIQMEELSGVVLFESHYILYYSGFAFIPTERPIAFVMNAHGERGLFVPRLEVEHAQSLSMIDRVDHYLEYPFDPHPMVLFSEMLRDMGIEGNTGADHDGYPWIMGYRGPSLSELLGTTPNQVTAFVEDQMMIKSQAELNLIRESVKWGHLAHVLLQRYTKVGATETEVSLRASNEATLRMLDTIGPIYRAQSYFSDGASAGYRGQIGRNSAIPHALSNNIIFQAGDVLVTGANAPVWGYNSELERTMIIGKATNDQQRFFDHMVALQDASFQAMQPGAPCSVVDEAVRRYFDKHDLMPYWKHHVGHAIGLRYHEGPFMDIGDDTIMQPGMVFTIEPGLYHPELGGFSHSDTVAITEDGIEIMTYYPRDLESLTIPA